MEKIDAVMNAQEALQKEIHEVSAKLYTAADFTGLPPSWVADLEHKMAQLMSNIEVDIEHGMHNWRAAAARLDTLERAFDRWNHLLEGLSQQRVQPTDELMNRLVATLDEIKSRQEAPTQALAALDERSRRGSERLDNMETAIQHLAQNALEQVDLLREFINGQRESNNNTTYHTARSQHNGTLGGAGSIAGGFGRGFGGAHTSTNGPSGTLSSQPRMDGSAPFSQSVFGNNTQPARGRPVSKWEEQQRAQAFKNIGQIGNDVLIWLAKLEAIASSVPAGEGEIEQFLRTALLASRWDWVVLNHPQDHMDEWVARIKKNQEGNNLMEKQMQFGLIRREPGETLAQFHSRITDGARAYARNAPESEMIHMFYRGLDSTLQDRLLNLEVQPTTLADALSKAERMESLWMRSRAQAVAAAPAPVTTTTTRTVRQSVNTVAVTDDDGESDTSSVMSEGSDVTVSEGFLINLLRHARGTGCFACGKEGHFANNCPTPRTKPANAAKWCEHHKSTTHNTEDCRYKKDSKDGDGKKP